MPRCLTDVSAALKVMPVAWSGPTGCCRQPMPMPLDLLRCSLAPVASTCRATEWPVRQLECLRVLWCRLRGGAGMVKTGHLGG